MKSINYKAPTQKKSQDLHQGGSSGKTKNNQYHFGIAANNFLKQSTDSIAASFF